MVVTAAALGAEHPRGRRVTERLENGLLRLAEWEKMDPAIACGITTAARGDFVVGGEMTSRPAERYASLARELGFRRLSVPSQVHGTQLREARSGSPEGPDDPVARMVTTAGRADGADLSDGPTARAARSAGRVDGAGSSRDPVAPAVTPAGRVDGQWTDETGWLLAATAADCVPVHLWCPKTGRLALVHAGWRGAAAGIIQHALARFRSRGSGVRRGLMVHLGPAICGECYEVDAPVLTAFGLRPKRDEERARLDLRGQLAGQALAAGVDASCLSVSRYCTACGPLPLHSHRASGGRAGRMAAFLGRRSS